MPAAAQLLPPAVLPPLPCSQAQAHFCPLQDKIMNFEITLKPDEGLYK